MIYICYIKGLLLFIFKLEIMRKPVTRKFLTLLLLTGVFAFSTRANAQCSIAVHNQVNAALSPVTCSYTPTVSDFLVSQNCPGGSLVAQVLIGGVWVTSPTFTYSSVNQNYQFRVRDQVSGNFAVGNLKIQDKNPPVITCGLPATIYCENTCTALPSPTVNDCDPNCTITFTETTILPACANPNIRIISRVYKATDAGGNTATCAWTYNIRRRQISDITYPASLTLNVSGTDCSPWCENWSSNPAPSPTSNAAQFGPGVPTIGGVPIAATLNPAAGCNARCVPSCGLTANYSDAVTVLCGTNRRISRTWTITSSCGANATYVQTINIYTDGNTNCGQTCLPPTNLTHQLPNSTTVRFLWTASPSCVVNYQVQYRFKVGGVWSGWSGTAVLATNALVPRPAGAVEGQYKISTLCNGILSAVSPVYNFLMPAFRGATERSDDATTPAPVFSETENFPAVWPNPTRDEVNVDLGTPLAEPGLLTILAIDGRLVHTQPLPAGTQQATMRLAGQPDGLYFFQLQIDGKVTTEKVELINP